MDVQSISELDPAERRALFERDAGLEEIRDDVAEIVHRVREEGDVALREYCRKFDDVEVGNFDITDEAERAYESIDDDVREAIETAADNIRGFHQRQVREDWSYETEGRELGRRFYPLDSAGVYAPGGTAAYPSSALMGIVPAKAAGVDHVVAVTPPAEQINPVTLAAIHAGGADAVYQVGGAQAISAMAYGTESIDSVDVIVGPGNRWVTAAKAEVRGDVKIDMLAGPSEVLVLADGTADPERLAAEMVAQAEHDPHAAVVTVTDDEDLAAAVAEEIDAQAGERDREEIIRDALDNEASGVFVARSMSEAALFADQFAPEHIYVEADDEDALLDRIENYGSAFLGPYSPVAAGDYASGTNHVLPTDAQARLASGLSVDTFVRSATVQRLSEDGLSELRETITTLADREGLEAHAHSVDVRFEK
ncbi:histidinol dehydrogenase [Halapricum hydrolyticum]|uniref:Histidinol dehydrogenase n=1 Tax=Halapricum hydrolyticum TaxID=2979991 RepID=A0AAE3LFA7_9EURY|nr:histidinol dehydrogenase [Halapricum hydrolyticum]MCU4717960.1 histidinol dehydrogenase [Halapricum hydrolyticum]MCU4727125.1 histidinol dehydrogenase [Halapricum hydrolyticum]